MAATEMAMEVADQDTATAATAASVAIVATVTEARATAMVEATAATEHLLVQPTPNLLLAPLTQMLRRPVMNSMPSGPLTMPRTQSKTHTLRMVALQQ